MPDVRKALLRVGPTVFFIRFHKCVSLITGGCKVEIPLDFLSQPGSVV
jgi:hypothetical protein